MIYTLSSTDNKYAMPPDSLLLLLPIHFLYPANKKVWRSRAGQPAVFTVDGCSRLIILPVTIPWYMFAPTEFG